MKKTLVLSVCAVLPLMMPVAYGQNSGASGASSTSSPPAMTPGGGGHTGSPNTDNSSVSNPEGASDASAGAAGGQGDTSNSGATTTGPANAGSYGANSSSAQRVNGKSVKSDMMGQSVYNENGEKVGDVKDVVLGPDGKATNVIIGAGGFLGMGEHDVAIPFASISHADKKLILSGYSKDQLKALPRAKVTP